MASSANSANEKHFPAIKVQESVNNRPSIKEPLVSPRQTEMVPQATSTKDEAYDMLHSGFKPSELYPISTLFGNDSHRCERQLVKQRSRKGDDMDNQEAKNVCLLTVVVGDDRLAISGMFAEFAALRWHGMWSHEKVYMPNILRSVVAAVFTTPHPVKSHFFRRKPLTDSFAGSVVPEMQAPLHPNLTPAPQPVRIRSSCDSCSEAKVKCDKRRPACERCTSNQLQCTYSISRRHGSKWRLARGQGVTAQATAKVPQQIFRADGASSASAIEEHNGDTVGFSTHGYNEVGESGTATEAITFHNNHDLLNPLQYLVDDDFAVNSNVATSKPSASGLGSTLPTLYDLSGDVYLSPSQQENGQAPCMLYATPSTTSVYGEDSRMSEYSYSDATDTFKKLDQASGHGTPKEVHDCEAFALTLLRSLHQWPLYPTDKHRQMAPSTQACPFPEPYHDTNTAGPEAIPSLDTILHANKRALSRVVKLLECSCARKPHLATLSMSIITKILSLYELAMSTDISLPGSSSLTTSTDPMQNSSSRPHLARTAIIQVGVFDLDEEDQATLQRGILLRQLRNMERAIEKFACLDIGDANDHDVVVRQWHNVSVSMIKKELQRLYHNCKERLLIIA